MYLATIRRERDTLTQGVALIRWPAPGPDSFVRRYRASIAAIAEIPLLSAFLALDLDADGRITTTHSFIAAAEDAGRLRGALAALMRLDGVDGAEVATPGDTDSFVGGFLGPDRPRFAPDVDLIAATGGVEIRPPFTLADALGPVVQDLAVDGRTARFEFAFAPMLPEPEVVRTSLHRIVRLEAVRAPEELLVDQRERVEILRRATHHMVEGVVGDAEALAAIERSLARQPDAFGYDRIGMEPALVELDADEAESLGLLAHPWLVLEDLPPDAAGFHETDSYRKRLTGVGVRGHASGAAYGTDAGASPLEVLLATDAAADSTGSAPYLFLSYAHADEEATQEVIALLDRAGIRVWYDTGLVGGSHWDSQLEDRILKAAGVVCLVTDRYVASRICQRELKFADVLGKPLLVLTDPDVRLGEGLHMILASLQYIDRTAPDLDLRLAAAVERHAPAAIEHDAQRREARA